MLGPLQLPPKQQQQQGQGQLQQQQLPSQNAGNQHQADLLPPPQSGQDFTLSSVLHFLQTEWRRYERDRNEWEIERAEMRARIALLEGERRSFENVKLDLMRRIKMLEYALRVERSKQLAQPSIPASKSAQSQGTKEDKEGSGGSSPRSEDSSLPQERAQPNGTAATGPPSRPQTWAGGPNWQMPNGPPAANSLGKPPPGRDPKSRARSRDYLKQCLQEISYLTSPQAMNPLPNRPLLNNQSVPLSLPNVPSFEQMAYNGRPRKAMPEVGKDFPPMLNGANLMSGSSSTSASSQVNPLERAGNLIQQQQQQQQPTAPPQNQPQPQTQQQQAQAPPQLQTQLSEREGDIEPQPNTAIFRPDDAGEWREKLRLSRETAERERNERNNEAASTSNGASSWERRPSDEDGSGNIREVEEEDDDDESTSDIIGEGSEGDGGKLWKPKRTLRNHLDAIRAIAFHPTELCLASAGDDLTVKIWRMDVSGLASSTTRATTEVEPQLSLRGHRAAITRLIHAPSKGLLFSASLDASIRIWALPSANHTTYAPYDDSRALGELIGHTDAVWDLALVRDESTLISCGAEGAVKVWDVSKTGGSLRLSWLSDGVTDEQHQDSDPDTPGATAVEAIKTDLKKVAVAYQDSVVKIFDIETGKEVLKLSTDFTNDEGLSTQVNSLVSHPTMPLLITAHEDKHIRIFDIITGQCTHSMLAHLDGVTSLSIDPSGFSLVSGGHDCSVRFWDILGSRACVQDINVHREKAREGVLAVEYHQSLPFVASAGSDGIVKLYSSS